MRERSVACLSVCGTVQHRGGGGAHLRGQLGRPLWHGAAGSQALLQRTPARVGCGAALLRLLRLHRGRPSGGRASGARHTARSRGGVQRSARRRRLTKFLARISSALLGPAAFLPRPPPAPRSLLAAAATKARHATSGWVGGAAPAVGRPGRMQLGSSGSHRCTDGSPCCPQAPPPPATLGAEGLKNLDASRLLAYLQATGSSRP